MKDNAITPRQQLEQAMAAEPLTKNYVQRMVAIAMQDPEECAEALIDMTRKGEGRLTWGPAWTLDWLSRQITEALEPFREPLVQMVIADTTDESVRRLLLNVLLRMPVEDEVDGRLYTYCFDNMLSASRQLSLRVVCVKIVYARALMIPELMQELQMVMQEADTSVFAPSMLSIRRRVLQQSIKRNKNRKDKL